MSIERTYYCDNRSCADDKPGDSTSACHARTLTPPPYLPSGFVAVHEEGAETLHFCSWGCLLRHAAQFPPTEFSPLEN